MLEILGKTNIDFMGKRHIAFVVSGVLSLLGLVAVVQISRGAANMGIDFAGAVATLHDVLAMLGAFYVLDKEITLLVVTALLTLAGYSLTDTVVVFDRIRENLGLRRREGIVAVINSSVNQVLSRTIVTSLTVVMVLIPLTLAGGEVLHDFSLALLWGVIVGTYSSVFVASPFLVIWPGGEGRLLRRG